ncbi:MAG TPA: hypothetical protein VGO03_05130 [Acidimicrobiia bacterium]
MPASNATTAVPKQEVWLQRVSVPDPTAGPPQVGDANHASLSADGRFVAFDSGSSTIVPGDTNGYSDVFVRDMATGSTQRVSVGNEGEQITGGGSWTPSISADGRYVAFASDASNVLPGDLGGNIYVRDTLLGTTQKVSVGLGGVAANGGSYHPSISADGRYVAFDSNARNLVANYPVYSLTSVFVYDRVTNTTQWVSKRIGAGEQVNAANPSIDADGRYVAFDGMPQIVPGGNGFRAVRCTCTTAKRTPLSGRASRRVRSSRRRVNVRPSRATVAPWCSTRAGALVRGRTARTCSRSTA